MDDLPIQQKVYLNKGGASLHSLTNVAYGTQGWHVLELVRKGFWVKKTEEPDQHGYTVANYGAIATSQALV